MKKFSFLLVLFFLTTLTAAQTTTNSTATKATCRDLLTALRPCTTGQGFMRLTTPINATCCNQINQIGDTCPGMYRRMWFARAHQSCKPANPGPSPQPPPSPVGETCDFSRLKPCFYEMGSYLVGLQNSTITAGCCSTLLDLHGCGSAAFRWPLLSKSLDYCQTHH